MTINIALALLSAFLLLPSSIKFLGWQKMVFETQLAMFNSNGINRKVMLLDSVAGEIRLASRHTPQSPLS